MAQHWHMVKQVSWEQTMRQLDQMEVKNTQWILKRENTNCKYIRCNFKHQTIQHIEQR